MLRNIKSCINYDATRPIVFQWLKQAAGRRSNTFNTSTVQSLISSPSSRICRSMTTVSSSTKHSGISSIGMTEKTLQLANALTKTDCRHEDGHKIRNQRRFALSRSITLVESTAASHRHQADLLLTHLLSKEEEADSEEIQRKKKRSFCLGIAGPPGAGKSTFIEAFGRYLLEMKDEKDIGEDVVSNSRSKSSSGLFIPSKLAVLCIDPSSTVTGGSILGDKTRMIELSRHERAYVRPSSNGGTFGGLSAYTYDVVSLCHAADYDLVIVESVGLGQSEVEIAQSVDMLILIVPPGGGDELQGVKKGIVEVADMILVNKADGSLLSTARSTAVDYRNARKYIRQHRTIDGWDTPPVLLTSAHTSDGIAKVWDEINKYRNIVIENGDLLSRRREQSNYWMWKNLQNLISVKTQNDPLLREKANAMKNALDRGLITPRVAASELLECLTSES